MNVSLTPQLEELVNSKVASGLYNSASEVVREALRLLDEHDRIRDVRIQRLREEIAIGQRQLDEGKGIRANWWSERFGKRAGACGGKSCEGPCIVSGYRNTPALFDAE